MNGCLYRVTHNILKSLLYILHGRGVSFGEFSRVAKQAFVGVAEQSLIKSGERVTTSRIAITTGLTRKEVALIRKNTTVEHVSTSHFNRSTRVTTGWITDLEFQEKTGKPAELPILGSKGSFEALVMRYSGDIPHRAMLNEMKRVGVVTEDNGHVSLTTDGYIPIDDEEKLNIMGQDVSDMLTTIAYNLENSEDAKFQRKVSYDNLPLEALPQLKRMVSEDGLGLLIKFNEFLATQDRDANPSAKGSGKVRAGVGIYYFEESQDRSEKHDA